MALLILLALLAAAFDARQRIIPNWICALVALLGVALQFLRLSAGFYPVLYASLSIFPATYHIIKLLPAAWTCLAAGVLLLALGFALELLVRRVRGQAGMGMGDIKYIAAWAFVLGWFVLPALAIACLLGAAYALSQHQHTFALGPWLSLAFIAILFLLLFMPSATLLFA